MVRVKHRGCGTRRVGAITVLIRRGEARTLGPPTEAASIEFAQTSPASGAHLLKAITNQAVTTAGPNAKNTCKKLRRFDNCSTVRVGHWNTLIFQAPGLPHGVQPLRGREAEVRIPGTLCSLLFALLMSVSALPSLIIACHSLHEEKKGVANMRATLARLACANPAGHPAWEALASCWPTNVSTAVMPEAGIRLLTLTCCDRHNSKAVGITAMPRAVHGSAEQGPRMVHLFKAFQNPNPHQLPRARSVSALFPSCSRSLSSLFLPLLDGREAPVLSILSSSKQRQECLFS